MVCRPKSYLEKENVLDILSEPSRLYNWDETGVQLCPKTEKLLGAKKQKNLYYISPGKEKECITVFCTYSADGNEIAPMIVYPYKMVSTQRYSTTYIMYYYHRS